MIDSDGSTQLNMDFSSENLLGREMAEGNFFILLEYDTPVRDQPFDSAVAMGASLAKRIRSADEILGISVTDRLRGEATHDPVDTASVLNESSEGKPLILHLSGKGSSPGRIQELLAKAASAGIKSILAVTGAGSDKHEFRRNAVRPKPYRNGYLDSLEIIKLAKKSDHGFLIGSAVNPAKYNPVDQFLQYYKMVRKLATGSEFSITQTTWDMKKLQEIQWYLQMREIGNPVVARLALLSAEEIENIHRGYRPGIHIAKPFAAMLQRESNISRGQSLAAQLTRVGLQVAGCRLLGYNGVQLSGIRDVQTLEMAISKIKDALEVYVEYSDWLAAWNDFNNFLHFEPIQNAYYTYEELLTDKHQHYDPEACKMTDRPLPKPKRTDLVLSRVAGFLQNKHIPEPVRNALRRIILHGSPVPYPLLKYCCTLNPVDCPKNLVYGACGGSAPDGTCEFGHAPCFFRRVLTLAAHRHELDRLEEGLPDD